MFFKREEIDMTTGKLLPKMIRFALPILLSTVLQLLFNAADIVVVSRFAGSAAFAAVGSTGALINLIINLFVGLSVGASIMVAKSYGAKDPDMIKRSVHTAVTTSLIGGVGLGILGFVLAKPLLTLMGTPDDVIGLAVLYMRIYFMGMPAVLFYNFGSAVMKSSGDPDRPLMYLTISGVLNVLLNLFFVIVLHMTVDGVAIATIASQTLSSVLVLRYLLKTDKPIHLNLKELKIDPKILGEMLRIGIPAGIQASLFSLSNVVIQSAVNSFGKIAIAANSAVGNIGGFIYASFNAIQQAALNFASQNKGARLYKRATKVLWCALLMVTSSGVFLCTTATIFGNTLLHIYSSDPNVIVKGLTLMHIMTIVYYLFGIGDVMGGYLRGMGYSILPMMVTLIGVCGLRVVWISWIYPIFGSFEWIFYSYPVSWIITCIAMFISIWLTCGKYWGRSDEECRMIEI